MSEIVYDFGMNILRQTLAVVLSAGLLSACTSRYAVRSDFYSPTARPAKLPVKVAVLSEPALPEEVRVGDPFCKSRIALEPGLRNALKSMLETVYERVEFAPTAAQAGDADYFVRVGPDAPSAIELAFEDPKTGRTVATYREPGEDARFTKYGLGATIALGLIVVIIFPITAAILPDESRKLGRAYTAGFEELTAKALDRIAERILQEGVVTQSPADRKAAEEAEARGDAAAKAGRHDAALLEYAMAMRGTWPGGEIGRLILEKTARSAGALGALPPPSEEAKRYLTRGEILFKEAASERDYWPAIMEMQKALQTAPWWPAAHFNLGLALDGASDWAGAARHLKLYLAAAPYAEDREQVKAKIIELELRQERQATVDSRKTEDVGPPLPASK